MTTELTLSAAQSGVWYALKAGASMPAFNIAEYVRIAGPVDPSLFEAALRQVVLETDTLRIRFGERDDGPYQVIGSPHDWRPTFQDVSAEADPVAAAVAWMHDDITRPLDRYAEPFFTFALFKAGPGDFLWYLRYHHLTMDGFGSALIVRRVAEIYSAQVAGTPADPRPLGSLTALVAEDAAYSASRHFESDRQYWLEVMAGCPEPPGLGVRTATPGPLPFLRTGADLPPETATRLDDFARRTELTFPQVVTLATAIFIHRLTDAEDVVLGQTLAARMSPPARQTPAMAMNVVPLRLEIRSGMTVAELAQQVRRKARRALRHQRYPIADLRRDLRRIDRPIIRQFVSVRPFEQDVSFAGARGTAAPISNGPVDDLSVQAVYDAAAQGVRRIEFDASPAGYDADFLARLLARFLRLLASLTEPEAVVGRLDLLPPEERRHVLTAWNGTRREYPRDRRIDDLFKEQARRTPDRIAVTCGAQHLTYRALDDRAERLARHLRGLGIGPAARVALHVERSADMVAALLGILKAGGAYVPLDPNYPQDRLAFILEDAAPRVLVTQRSLLDRLPTGGGTEVVCLDALPDAPEGAETRPGGTPQAGMRPAGDLAYVLYTSGSTGRPKGVQVSHRALVNFLTAMAHKPGITAADRLLAITSLSFDIAALELFLPLLAGARVTVAPVETAADGLRLAALMAECGATIMQATPATWRLLLEAGWRGDPALTILCGGEAWPADLARALRLRCGALWNMYGPTETTVWSAVARIEAGDPVLIGPPIANTTFYVLDAQGEPVPVGVPGELHIGGESVARGYLNRPELTAGRFAADPFGDDPAGRMYRTGDRVRQMPDGRLEFLGRLDHQVKLRGHRIEPGEIEAALRQHPDVQDAVVVAQEVGAAEKRLVAYVTARGPAPVAAGDLRDRLRRQLPAYMVPAVFVPLEAFPLTPNGKIDRAALPAPDEQARRVAGGVAHVAPRTNLEELVAGCWRDCLRLERVGIHDNFFDLGGDSLAMLQLSLGIERATGESFPLNRIFEAPTVAGMADLLDGGRTAPSGYSPLVTLRPGAGAPAVFMVHPVGGSTVQLAPIARAFPAGHPVHGVQARGLDGADPPNDRVEAMADDYIAAITAEQPHGPYFLVGMCFGGLVALEIARRLAERGEPIGLVAFLDTYPHPRGWPWRLRFSYFVLRRIGESWLALARLRRHELAAHVAGRLAAAARKLAAAARGRPPFLQAPDSLPPAVKAVFQGGIAALEHYRPRPYPGTVRYLMCGYHAYLPNGPAAVWTRLVGRLEVQSVPAALLMTPAHPEYVANWLADRIRAAPEPDAGSKRAGRRPGRLARHVVRIFVRAAGSRETA